MCLDHYDAETDAHGSGDVLAAAEYPAYFAALEALRTIAAIDAAEDARTAELRHKYLHPHGITTMLDAPVVLSGEVVGVVCHEHVGPRREWPSVERMFAGSVADLVALALQSDYRVRAERECAELRERLHALQPWKASACWREPWRTTVFRDRFDGVARAPEWDWRAGPGETIALEVVDDGVGMDDETRERMFEPCFTTKPGGTGLGLAAALGIIRGHRGAVEIASAPGQGTTVRVTLPAIDVGR